MSNTGKGPALGLNRKYKKHTKGTYIGLVAYVIQDSPDKMLTFKEIMKKLGVFVTGDKKGLENNIRVCLSANKCFVKVPIDPEYPNAKRNFWRVDESSITPKMLRRHFSHMVDLFPGLPPGLDRKPAAPIVQSSPVCPVRMDNRPVKFTGPFSIESLLKNEHVPQARIAVQQPAQAIPNANPGFSGWLYGRPASTNSVTGLDRQHSVYYMYRSVDETNWVKPDIAPEMHRALLYSQYFYDHN